MHNEWRIVAALGWAGRGWFGLLIVPGETTESDALSSLGAMSSLNPTIALSETGGNVRVHLVCATYLPYLDLCAVLTLWSGPGGGLSI